MQGNLRKMEATLADVVQYTLVLGEHRIPLNDYIGKPISLRFAGQIHCISCGRTTNKSFNQGYCYPCFRDLAACDQCIIKPELCHYHQGTCREPEWGEKHCMQPHCVYLAQTSGLKVGITRITQIPTRWIDQGAVQAMPIFSVRTRRQSGLVEDALRQYVADKTHWRRMLAPQADMLNLAEQRDALLLQAKDAIAGVQAQFPEEDIHVITGEAATTITYPVNVYPDKVQSLNAHKTPHVTGVLQGIKGQYLLLDCGVINLRKYGGYWVHWASV